MDTVDSAQLGVWVGPINIGDSACADDEYLMSDSQAKLQTLLEIAEYYGEMYLVKYGASKTDIDDIYRDILLAHNINVLRHIVVFLLCIAEES